MNAINSIGMDSLGGAGESVLSRQPGARSDEKSVQSSTRDMAAISEEAQRKQAYTVQEGLKAGYLQEVGSGAGVAQAPAGQTASGDTLSGLSSTGTQVAVTRNAAASPDKVAERNEATAPSVQDSYSASFVRADGSSLNVSFSENLFVQEGADGTTSAFDSHANKTRMYAPRAE